jgi:hypothetical protein
MWKKMLPALDTFMKDLLLIILKRTKECLLKMIQDQREANWFYNSTELACSEATLIIQPMPTPPLTHETFGQNISEASLSIFSNTSNSKLASKGQHTPISVQGDYASATPRNIKGKQRYPETPCISPDNWKIMEQKSNESIHGGNTGGKSSSFGASVVTTLKEWISEHRHNPYPRDDEKRNLCNQTGITIQQLNNWFINARRRILPKLADGSGSEEPNTPS